MLLNKDFRPDLENVEELGELITEEEWTKIWELMANDDEILEDIRMATLKDKVLKPIIAYLKSGLAAAQRRAVGT
jgi:hypothetical protein